MSVIGAQAGRPEFVSRGPFWLQPPTVAVLGAMTFNFILCFVNTNAGGVGTAAVIGCELVIISSVLFYSYPILSYPQFLVVACMLLYLVTLSAIRPLLGGGIDVKPVRDLLIPIAFFLLGVGSPDLKAADRIVRVVTWIVIGVGMFEYFLPDVYTRFFNVASFYIERGTMEASQAQQTSNLFVSGMRPEGVNGGRNLLPILGNHRISSIFLKPVSAGNFGIVIFFWALVRSLMERRIYWGLFAAAAVAIVMSDSRFGAFFCAICLLLAFCPASIRAAVVAALPACGLMLVAFLPGLMSDHYRVSAGLLGRITLAGAILDRYDGLNWLGLKAPEFVTSDSGYAYTLAGFGLLGMIGFWAVLMSLKGTGRSFYLFRDLAGAYFALLLCISNSPYTIKTGALLWFLAGVLSQGDKLRTRFAGPVGAAPRQAQPSLASPARQRP